MICWWFGVGWALPPQFCLLQPPSLKDKFSDESERRERASLIGPHQNHPCRESEIKELKYIFTCAASILDQVLKTSSSHDHTILPFQAFSLSAEAGRVAHFKAENEAMVVFPLN